MLNRQEKNKALDIFFDSKTNHIKKEFVGQSALSLVESLGVKTEHNHQPNLLIAPAKISEMAGPLGNEKLAPILSLFEVSSVEEALKFAKSLLESEGQGRTAVVHTSDQAKARKYGDNMPAGRILINAASSHGCIGVGTGLFPAFTLGCGTYGGNSTTDNVNYTNVMNVKRLAFAG